MRILLIFLLLIPSAHALTVGVSPPRIIEPHLLPGSVFQEVIVLSKDGDHDILMLVDIEGEVSSWIDHPSEIILSSSKNNVQMPINISVPEDTPTGNYSAIIYYSVPTEEEISIALSVTLELSVIDEEWELYEIKHPSVEQKDGRTTLSFILDNKGNIPSGPKSAHITITDNLREQILFEDKERITKVAPFSSEEREAVFKTELPNGLYWVNVSLDDYNELVVLEVEENYVPPNDPSIIIAIILIVLVTGLVRYFTKKGG